MISTRALAPGLPGWLLDCEIAAAGAAMWLVPLTIQVRPLRRGAGTFGPIGGTRVLLALCSSWPFIVCGVLLFLGAGNGLYWSVAGMVVALTATVINAWVLLIEILR